MERSGCRTREKIRATKGWLTKAEEHFDRESASRVQLDLMLAAAELRSTQDTLAARPQNSRTNLLRHSLAVGLALLIVGVGIGGFWWLGLDQSRPAFRRGSPGAPLDASVISSPVSPQPAAQISAIPARKLETVSAATVDSPNSRQEVKNDTKSAEREMPVTQDEMKRLIHTAGQSLRGRTKQ